MDDWLSICALPSVLYLPECGKKGLLIALVANSNALRVRCRNDWRENEVRNLFEGSSYGSTPALRDPVAAAPNAIP